MSDSTGNRFEKTDTSGDWSFDGLTQHPSSPAWTSSTRSTRQSSFARDRFSSGTTVLSDAAGGMPSLPANKAFEKEGSLPDLPPFYKAPSDHPRVPSVPCEDGKTFTSLALTGSRFGATFPLPATAEPGDLSLSTLVEPGSYPPSRQPTLDENHFARRSVGTIGIAPVTQNSASGNAPASVLPPALYSRGLAVQGTWTDEIKGVPTYHHDNQSARRIMSNVSRVLPTRASTHSSSPYPPMLKEEDLKDEALDSDWVVL